MAARSSGGLLPSATRGLPPIPLLVLSYVREFMKVAPQNYAMMIGMAPHQQSARGGGGYKQGGGTAGSSAQGSFGAGEYGRGAGAHAGKGGYGQPGGKGEGRGRRVAQGVEKLDDECRTYKAENVYATRKTPDTNASISIREAGP